MSTENRIIADYQDIGRNLQGDKLIEAITEKSYFYDIGAAPDTESILKGLENSGMSGKKGNTANYTILLTNLKGGFGNFKDEYGEYVAQGTGSKVEVVTNNITLSAAFLLSEEKLLQLLPSGGYDRIDYIVNHFARLVNNKFVRDYDTNILLNLLTSEKLKEEDIVLKGPSNIDRGTDKAKQIVSSLVDLITKIEEQEMDPSDFILFITPSMLNEINKLESFEVKAFEGVFKEVRKVPASRLRKNIIKKEVMLPGEEGFDFSKSETVDYLLIHTTSTVVGLTGMQNDLVGKETQQLNDNYALKMKAHGIAKVLDYGFPYVGQYGNFKFEEGETTDKE